MSSQPAAVTVVSGSEELLVSRAVRDVVAAVSAAAAAGGGRVEVRDIAAADAGEAELVDLGSPSLFADPRVLVLRSADELAAELRDAVLAYAADPLPEVFLVVAMAATPRGRSLQEKLKAAGAEVVVCRPPTRPKDKWDFVQGEARAAGGQITAGACRAIVETVGGDLRALASVTAQLVSDTAGPIDEAVVARYHQGRAETRGFDVADATLSGDLGSALALLYAALDSGLAPVVLTATLASGLRDLARVRGVSGDPAAIAESLKMPAWKVEKVLRASRSWTDQELSAAIAAVAVADGAVKGGGVDAAYAVERVVVTVARSRGQRAGARP